MEGDTVEPLPRFSKSQQIGRQAYRCLQMIAPRNWLMSSFDGDDDLGFDLGLQVLAPDGRAQFPLRAQLKGTTNPQFNEDGSLSIELKTETLNYYLRTDEPVMLIGVALPESGDLKKGQPFFCWVQDQARNLLEAGQQFLAGQKGYTIRLPAENRITDHLDILPELQRRLELSRSLRELSFSVERGVPGISFDDKVSSLRRIGQHITREGATYLELPELDTESPWPQAAQATFARELNEVAASLRAGDIERATHLLDRCTSQLSESTPRERAEYVYLRGRIASLCGQDKTAEDHYKESLGIQPQVEKYRVAILEATFAQQHLPNSGKTYGDLLEALQPLSSAGAAALRSRILAATGDFLGATNELKSVPEQEALVPNTLILFLKGSYDELIAFTDRALTQWPLLPRVELVLRLLRTRSFFHKAIGVTDTTLPPYGQPTTNVVGLQVAWTELMTVLGLASRLRWPQPVEFLFDVVSFLSSALSRHLEVLDAMREAARTRTDSLAAQLCYMRIARGAQDHGRAAEKARELLGKEGIRSDLPELALTFYDAGCLAECIEVARDIEFVERSDNLASPFGDLSGIAIAVAISSADRLSRPSEAEELLARLEKEPRYEGERALLRYVRKVSQKPLEREDALKELLADWQRLRHPGLALHLIRDSDVSQREHAEVCAQAGEALAKDIRLGPGELRQIAQAYATLGRWQDLAQLATDANEQFRDDFVLVAARALALDNLGDTRGAIALLETVPLRGGKERFPLQVYANIAGRCGLSAQAIELLELLLERETKRERRLELFQTLYSLEYERAPQSQRALELCWAIGQTVSCELEGEEGLFLVAFATLTASDGARPTPTQLQEFQTRAEAFVDRFPLSQVFRMFRAPESATEFEELLRREGMLEDQRPRELVALETRLKRGAAVPYCWRPRAILRNVVDVGHLWALTKATKEAPEYELLITNADPQVLDREVRIDGVPLIDITALLVLSDLGVLEKIFEAFPKIAVTKLTLLELRRIGHPILGGASGKSCMSILACLRDHLDKVSQPGATHASDLGVRLSRLREQDQLEVLSSGGHVFYCDDAIFLQHLSAQGYAGASTDSVQVLALMDQMRVLSAVDAAEAFSKLCSWNIGHVIVTGRHFFAAMSEHVRENANKSELEVALDGSPARRMYDALWSSKKPYIDVLRHITWVLTHLLVTNPRLERLASVLLNIWYVKAKLRNENLAPPRKHLVYVLVNTVKGADRLSAPQIHSLWNVYQRVVEWEMGDRMSRETEDDAMRLVAQTVALPGGSKISVDDRIQVSRLLFQRLQSGLTSGTREYDVFADAYNRAQAVAILEAQRKK